VCYVLGQHAFSGLPGSAAPALPRGFWALRGGGSALTMPRNGAEAVLQTGRWLNGNWVCGFSPGRQLLSARPPSHPPHPLPAAGTAGGIFLAFEHLERALKAVPCAQGFFPPRLLAASRGMNGVSHQVFPAVQVACSSAHCHVSGFIPTLGATLGGLL